jgi:hypothetical protein
MVKIKKAIHKNTKDAVERAKEDGIDITILYENLSRTPTERIENFLRWLEFAEELRRAKQRKERINEQENVKYSENSQGIK